MLKFYGIKWQLTIRVYVHRSLFGKMLTARQNCQARRKTTRCCLL